MLPLIFCLRLKKKIHFYRVESDYHSMTPLLMPVRPLGSRSNQNVLDYEHLTLFSFCPHVAVLTAVVTVTIKLINDYHRCMEWEGASLYLIRKARQVANNRLMVKANNFIYIYIYLDFHVRNVPNSRLTRPSTADALKLSTIFSMLLYIRQHSYYTTLYTI